MANREHQASIAFRRLIPHSVIVEEVAQLTGAAELRIWHDQIQYKPAEVGGVINWYLYDGAQYGIMNLAAASGHGEK